MKRNQEKVSAGGMLVLLTLILNVVIFKHAMITGSQIIQLGWITVPLFIGSMFALKR